MLEHERVIDEYVKKIMKEIMLDGVLHYPLLVEKRYHVILDGHHRYNALKRLGATLVPVFIVDYSSPNIIVRSWRPNIHVTKELVLHAALSHNKLPPKTSKHIVNGIKIPRIDIPLHILLSKSIDPC